MDGTKKHSMSHLWGDVARAADDAMPWAVGVVDSGEAKIDELHSRHLRCLHPLAKGVTEDDVLRLDVPAQLHPSSLLTGCVSAVVCRLPFCRAFLPVSPSNH